MDVMDFDAATRQRMAAIEANWDERVPIHEASRFYAREAKSWFPPYEWEDLGDPAGRDVVHLQCHLGTETLAFAERGARSVVGLDLSAASCEAARRRAATAGAEIEYVQANVYDAAEALGGRKFDIVYTGKGALVYLPDLTGWAEQVAALLRPGGIAYIVEFHPVFHSLGVQPGGDSLLLRHDYLAGRGPHEKDATYTYTDGPPLTHATTSYEWSHGLGEVINALVGAGLSITSLRESDEIPWPNWPDMEQTPEGFFRRPASVPRIPLLYALRATAA
jgi:SAM-dependent methyltransferase